MSFRPSSRRQTRWARRLRRSRSNSIEVCERLTRGSRRGDVDYSGADALHATVVIAAFLAVPKEGQAATLVPRQQGARGSQRPATEVAWGCGPPCVASARLLHCCSSANAMIDRPPPRGAEDHKHRPASVAEPGIRRPEVYEVPSKADARRGPPDNLIPGSQSSNLGSPGIILLFGRAADPPTPRAIPIPKVRTLWDRYERMTRTILMAHGAFAQAPRPRASS